MRYSLEQIHILYDYDMMINVKPYQKKDIDSIMSILYTNLNTTKATIKIGGDEKPSIVVIGKLMKLTALGIMYAIEKFKEQTERIKNPTNYMLTLLYNAEEQMHLDLDNKENVTLKQIESKISLHKSIKTLNRFNNFPQREYTEEDIRELEKLLLKR